MNSNDLFEQRKSFTLEVSPIFQGAILGALLVGVITLIYGFFSGLGERVWGAFLFNLFFFFCIGFGAMVFSAIQDTVSAQWSRPIRRVYDALGSFVPLGGLLILVFIAAVALDVGDAGKVYSWIEDPEVLSHFPGKVNYLQPGWMYFRVILAVVSIVALVLWQFKHSLRSDILFVEGRRQESEILAAKGNFMRRFWSAPILVVYGVAFTSLCFDLTMSLAPAWFSTLWGGWQLAVMMQTLMATLLIIMFALRSTKLGEVMKRDTFHDVGKLMHGFTVFFAYLSYAHVLTYWFANMPETTEYFIHRLHEPWIGFVKIAPILGFVVPLYVMIFKHAKWTAWIAIPMASIILLAQWFIALLVVMPQIVDAKDFGMPFIEVGLFLGVLGVFAFSFLRFFKKYPLVAVSDPLLAEALDSAGHH